MAKGYRQYFLQLSDFPIELAPVWQFSVFRTEDHWNMSHTQAAGMNNQWVQPIAVRQGTTQHLYCNGELNDTGAVFSQPLAADSLTKRDTSDDFAIGGFIKEALYPITGHCYFKGSIDEVRVSSVVRNPDWIRLSYMNQRGDDKLVQFKER